VHRERALLDALNPHLVQLYRAHEARQRLREALALHESTQTAVVLVEADDRVASPARRRASCWIAIWWVARRPTERASARR
jgi:hypothetical protein